ncbi:helix-turn-helix transcriptional regulator [Luteolibacter sp. AS25]|uniref:helix-turn-helix transcriptional regulator n=1 Tax=Luteolibacter sp. AS25 TaxID=3135776 RepID=UPI00398B650E
MHSANFLAHSDLRKLVRLIGDCSSQQGSLSEKQAFLLDGLAELIHADGWQVSRNGQIRSDSSELPSTHSYSIEHTETSEAGTSRITLFRLAGKKAFSIEEEKAANLVLQETVWLHHENQNADPGHPIPKLFPQELKTLRHLQMGKSRKKIAAIMALSEATISTYTKSVFRKLGVHSQSELIKKLNNGEIETQPND